jgi:hypothetical protein
MILTIIISLIIGYAVGLVSICLLTIGRMSQLLNQIDTYEFHTRKMENVLLDCTNEADHLLHAGIYGSTRDAARRITEMKDKITGVLDEYYRTHVTL